MNLNNYIIKFNVQNSKNTYIHIYVITKNSSQKMVVKWLSTHHIVTKMKLMESNLIFNILWLWLKLVMN
jgi:hypothetical protein